MAETAVSTPNTTNKTPAARCTVRTGSGVRAIYQQDGDHRDHDVGRQGARSTATASPRSATIPIVANCVKSPNSAMPMINAERPTTPQAL